MNFKKMEKSYSKTLISAGVLGSLVLGGLFGAYVFPNEVQVEVPVDKIVEVPVNVVEYVDNLVEVPVEVPVEVIVEKEVLVDNENLQMVLDHIYDNNGKVNYLTDDLDDDEAYMIADRVIFINEIKKLSVDAIKADLFDELDGVVVGLNKLDEDDMERLRIDDDADEIEIDDVDFEDGDAVLIVTGTFEQDDIKYAYSAEVKFRDGEYDELDNITVVEE